MDANLSQELIEYLKETDSFLLMSHIEPDGDCVGSSLGLGYFLRRIGKTVHLYSPGPFSRPEISDYEHLFKQKVEDTVKALSPSVIILDCSTPERVGDKLASDISGLECVVIDHHSAGEVFGNYRYINSDAPSTTCLVYEIIERMGYAVTQEEAEYLMLGMCTDTGFFRHLNAGQGDVFRIAADLVDAGASPKKMHRLMYGNKQMGTQLLLGRILSRMETACDGSVIISYEAKNDKIELGIDNRDSDTMYLLMQSIKGCEVVIMLSEEGGGLTVGLRSRDHVDVGSIARSFGGGGHKNAAGFSAGHISRREITEKVLTMVEKELNEA